MCIYIYVYIYIYIYIYIYTFKYVFIYIYICIQEYVFYIHIYICLDFYVFICTYMYLSIGDAGLGHGTNQVELEVYSKLTWKRYASQRIPDIHFFEHSVYEGYYVDFYLQNKTESYAMKTVATSVLAMIMAHTMDIGPTEAIGELKQLLSVAIKNHASIALMDGYVHICTHIYMCICKYMYIYIYIYIYMYVCKYIYAY
jgi:hypothetical protein